MGIVTLTPLLGPDINNNIIPCQEDADTAQCNFAIPVARVSTRGFLSCLIYWPIFPPLDCVSYQWLDICYIWIIAGRGSNVILMTDIHQSINVGCQSHAGSGIKKSEPGKHISISLPSRVSLDPGSAPGMTNGRFSEALTPYLDDRHSEMKDGCQSERLEMTRGGIQ